MSSLGVYRTDAPYIGKNGYSLRLVGLEKGYNDNVYSRAVVLHGAWYVSEKMIQLYGRLGRSYGCPAVRQEIATPLIDTIKDGSILFAYYPQQDWLQHSAFLHVPNHEAHEEHEGKALGWRTASCANRPARSGTRGVLRDLRGEWPGQWASR
jgi:hypothetical protein